jgi:hypothetical protein
MTALDGVPPASGTFLSSLGAYLRRAHEDLIARCRSGPVSLSNDFLISAHWVQLQRQESLVFNGQGKAN